MINNPINPIENAQKALTNPVLFEQKDGKWFKGRPVWLKLEKMTVQGREQMTLTAKKLGWLEWIGTFFGWRGSYDLRGIHGFLTSDRGQELLANIIKQTNLEERPILIGKISQLEKILVKRNLSEFDIQFAEPLKIGNEVLEYLNADLTNPKNPEVYIFNFAFALPAEELIKFEILLSDKKELFKDLFKSYKGSLQPHTNEANYVDFIPFNIMKIVLKQLKLFSKSPEQQNNFLEGGDKEIDDSNRFLVTDMERALKVQLALKELSPEEKTFLKNFLDYLHNFFSFIEKKGWANSTLNLGSIFGNEQNARQAAEALLFLVKYKDTILVD
jgi:hypothetical protein